MNRIISLCACLLAISFIMFVDSGKCSNDVLSKVVYSNKGNIYLFIPYNNTTSLVLSKEGKPDYYSFPDFVSSDEFVFSKQTGAFSNVVIAKYDFVTDLYGTCYTTQVDNVLSSNSNGNKYLAVLFVEKKSTDTSQATYKLIVVDKISGIETFVGNDLLFYKPTWIGDRYVFATKSDGLIIRYDLIEKSFQTLMPGFSPSPSPDGKYIAYYSKDITNPKSSLAIYDLSSKEEKIIVQSAQLGSTPIWSPDGKTLLYHKYKKKFFRPEESVIEMIDVNNKTIDVVFFVNNIVHGFSAYWTRSKN